MDPANVRRRTVNKLIILGAGVAATAMSMAVAETEVAGASSGPPDTTGQTYSAASAAISGAGDKAVVATTIGDQKAWSDCVVANQRVSTVQPPANSSGSATTTVLLSLNCYASEASAKAPGYSAASPEGKAAAAAAASASATPAPAG
jgi:hypothetical protein